MMAGQRTTATGPGGRRYYNVRDVLGHYVDPTSQRGKTCRHACCRGFRVHPENHDTVLPSRAYHRASDEELGRAFDKASRGDTKTDAAIRDQIIHELERRDRAQAKRRETEGRRQARHERHREAVSINRAARRMERESEVERVYLQAEDYTRGNWTNRAGRFAGITDREILTGPQRVFDRYASDEAREYFLSHERPTAGYFRRDTAEKFGSYAR